MNERAAVAAVAIALGLGVATGGCKTTTEADERARRPALTAEAQAMLARALSQPDASGLVLDVAALEQTGVASRDDALRQMGELVAVMLPYLAAEEDDVATKQLLGRLAVGAVVLRQWTDWPNVRGLAVSLGDLSRASAEGIPPKNQVVLVVAVANAEDQNRRLLEGVLALGRAAMAESHGKSVKLVVQQQDACLVDVREGDSFCLRPGNGFILMGTPTALQGFATLPQGTGGDGAALTGPNILRMRMHMAGQGTADVVVQGREALTVAANVQASSPVLLAKLEQLVNETLQKWDASRAEQRQLLEQSLQSMKQQLAADPAAPADMKEAAQALSVDRVMDPNGWWSQLRTSVKTERGQDRYTVAFTIPAAAVKELSEMGAGFATSAGIIAAVAVPNFMKFQCRSRQAEVRSMLKRIAVSQLEHGVEKKRYATTFRDLGIEADPKARYTYCMGADCLRCVAPGCEAANRQNPCAGMSSVGKTLKDGFQVCAYGDADSDPALDIWLVDEAATPQNAENDCK